MKTKLLFTKRTTPFILKALGKSIDKKGFVIDAKTKEYVLDIDGKPFKAKKLIGIVDKQFITNFFQFELTRALTEEEENF